MVILILKELLFLKQKYYLLLCLKNLSFTIKLKQGSKQVYFKLYFIYFNYFKQNLDYLLNLNKNLINLKKIKILNLRRTF